MAPKFMPPSLVSIQKITLNGEQSRNSDYSRTVFKRNKPQHQSVDFSYGLGYGGYESQSVSAQILVDPKAKRNNRDITFGTTELGQLSPIEGASRPVYNRTSNPSALSQYRSANTHVGSTKVQKSEVGNHPKLESRAYKQHH